MGALLGSQEEPEESEGTTEDSIREETWDDSVGERPNEPEVQDVELCIRRRAGRSKHLDPDATGTNTLFPQLLKSQGPLAL